MMRTDTVQRLRVTYGVDGPLIYLSVLDMGRLWERLLRRAGAPLAYTQGFNPHPRIQFAAALPVGYSSTCERIDLFLAEYMDANAFRVAAEGQAPAGLSILDVEQVPLKAQAPQSVMREAHYAVSIWTDQGPEGIQRGIAAFMAREAVQRERRGKGGRLVEYNLRPLVCHVALRESAVGQHRLHMVVRCGPHGAGRPEEVLAELGLPISHSAICRTRLIWGDGKESAA